MLLPTLVPWVKLEAFPLSPQFYIWGGKRTNCGFRRLEFKCLHGEGVPQASFLHLQKGGTLPL